MNRFKMIACIIMLAILAGLLPACTTDINKDAKSGDVTAAGTQQVTTTSGAADTTKPTEKTISNFNIEGFPIVNEPITLTMLAIQPSGMIDDWSKHLFFIRAQELTNIKFNISNVPLEVYNERKQLGWASGDLPDLFFKASILEAEEVIHGEAGLLVPLNGLIDKYAPNIQFMLQERPDAKKAITLPSGNIYTLPQVGNQSCHAAWYINKVWLDRLGVNEPRI